MNEVWLWTRCGWKHAGAIRETEELKTVLRWNTGFPTWPAPSLGTAHCVWGSRAPNPPVVWHNLREQSCCWRGAALARNPAQTSPSTHLAATDTGQQAKSSLGHRATSTLMAPALSSTGGSLYCYAKSCVRRRQISFSSNVVSGYFWMWHGLNGQMTQNTQSCGLEFETIFRLFLFRRAV